jgi:hypothetical protein
MTVPFAGVTFFALPRWLTAQIVEIGEAFSIESIQNEYIGLIHVQWLYVCSTATSH